MGFTNSDRIRELRQRAEEVRTIADSVRSPASRQSLLGVAANYERLADSLEKLSHATAEPEAPLA